MDVEKTFIDECYLLHPKKYEDNRGYFFESFNNSEFCNLIEGEISFIQDNQSHSKYGVLRGLHYQSGKFAQAKLVRVLNGEILDIVLDLRKHSPTFGKHFSTVLSSQNMVQLYVPKGMAHGFVVLSDSADVFYKVDNVYEPKSEGGILYNDPDLNIDWKINKSDIIINEKDLKLNTWKEYLDK
ncbi:dTDP-4-dehydrorhamnose 3,5-epimerase [Lutimonas zeaxanthinifaciens]|uniref:dTDP-4-dehydrorhamnose 3,5-epimerase n=1 Tax=Lutimonas zeaxanthinifaciens TaxID=3060215 RepID=UPI00265D2F40|nr:dTDP-4-dehydrorhamnose 3,5-epimerase [Lutimonas sp. YSD2104]WKK67341.1 dTDP-4-dehydrorhamnose 3,5-epimerase [Lutimonas sp. YSD2104]